MEDDDKWSLIESFLLKFRFREKWLNVQEEIGMEIELFLWEIGKRWKRDFVTFAMMNGFKAKIQVIEKFTLWNFKNFPLSLSSFNEDRLKLFDSFIIIYYALIKKFNWNWVLHVSSKKFLSIQFHYKMPSIEKKCNFLCLSTTFYMHNNIL